MQRVAVFLGGSGLGGVDVSRAPVEAARAGERLTCNIEKLFIMSMRRGRTARKRSDSRPVASIVRAACTCSARALRAHRLVCAACHATPVSGAVPCHAGAARPHAGAP